MALPGEIPLAREHIRQTSFRDNSRIKSKKGDSLTKINSLTTATMFGIEVPSEYPTNILNCVYVHMVYKDVSAIDSTILYS